MAAINVPRFFRSLLDVSVAGRADGTGMLWDSTSGLYRPSYLAAARRASLVVAGDLPAMTIGGSGFALIPCAGDQQLYDPGGNYNTVSSIYTVPITGLYQIDANIRLGDGAPATNYGHGVHTTNSDGSWFSWYQTNTNMTGTQRNGAIYRRVAFFNAGDPLRHYGYADQPVTILNRSMTIVFLSV